MSVTIGALRESAPQERRVSLVPEVADKLVKDGARVLLERGAGERAGFPDSLYKTVAFADSAAQLLQAADVLLTVQPLDLAQIGQLKGDAVVVGFMQPHARHAEVVALKTRGITSFAMELVPRISRAQSMDALSSQASIAGYKAVLIAANQLQKFLPMLTTAAGTIRPAQVLVIGAGVAGLQAIATARRLGAMVEAYDVRGATREQVKSLGAKFVETGVSAEGSGGYARELTAEEKAQAAGGARRAHRRLRRGRHHRLGAGTAGAEDHHARGRRAHAPRLGGGGYRRRAGRQLRAHPCRGDRGAPGSEHRRCGESAGGARLQRERDVRAQPLQFCEARARQGRAEHRLE